MSVSTPIIATKLLVPSRRGGLLHRPRVVDFLYANVDRKLIVVSAPAGYGKTSVLTDLASQLDVPVCWYALDEYDADPRVFLGHLVAAIDARFPGFGRRMEAALDNTTDVGSNIYSLAAVLANAIYAVEDFFVVVLDDFHHLESSEPINDFLSLLLRYTDDNFHLVLASRTLPAIPDQSLMAARGQMIGLSQDELKFTPVEIQQLVLQNFDLVMPDERAVELAQHSDGWITGILLTAHQATWKELVKGVVNLPEVSGRVYDYLAEQVLSMQTDPVRHFMLEASVLDNMTPGDCDTLMDRSDSAAMLHRMAHSNVFLSHAGNQVYSFHHLYRNFLRHRLRLDDPQRYRELMVTSAQLHAARGEWQRAVAIYLELGMVGEAADTLERTGRILLDARRWDSLAQWLDALPEPVLHAHPRLLALRATLHVERGEYEPALRLFEMALDAFRQNGQTADEVDATWRLALALQRRGHNKQSLEQVRTALGLLESIPNDPVRMRLYGRLLDCQGLCNYGLGNLPDAIRDLIQAAEVFGNVGDLQSAAGAHHNLGISYRAAGNVNEAVHHYRQALSYWAQLGNPGWLANTLNSLGIVYFLQGELGEAERILTTALETADQSGLLRLQSVILASQADLQRDLGASDSALKLFSQSRMLAEQVRDEFFAIYSLCGEGETLRQMNDVAASEIKLTQAEARARKIGSGYLLGLCQFRQGALALDLADFERAQVCLLAAHEVMNSGGYTHELAQVELLLGFRSFLAGQEEDALHHLALVDSLAGQLGYDYFLSADGRQMPGLLQLGAQRLSHPRRFEQALKRMGQTRPVRQPEPAATIAADGYPLRICGLGRGRVMFGDEELLAQREQVKELFFYLLLHHPQRVRKEAVIEQFWPDWPLHKADGSLRVTLYRLRRGICPVETEAGWLSLELPPGTWYDVWEFRRLLLEADQARDDPFARAQCLQQAIDLYSGDLMEQVTAAWVAAEREALSLEYQSALLALAQLRSQLGRNELAIDLFRRVLKRQPYHEQAWQGLMSAQANNGNRAAAMESFRQLRTLLRDDLGVDPSPGTQMVYRQLLETAR
ncbi:MAG: tetratricopeptide repeat protein [Anaerolineae bacterium]|nr:tetratricopeptide repeat protein [Anaerolineae bacterium]